LTGLSRWNVASPSFTRDFKTLAFSAEDSSHMAEVLISPLAPFSPRKLTDMTAQVRDWTLGTAEVVSWNP